MDEAVRLLARTDELYTRAASTGQSSDSRPPVYKAVGISLAVASGLFIGTSFVLKKTGLLKANVKYNEEAGEGYGYLKNAYWWSGMTLMIIGEICNFVAYAFVDAILVTPLGALSVVVTTILSAIFLKERLSFVGKVGCFQCIVGSVVIVLNAPQQSAAATIQDMKHYVIAPGFLSYAGVVIIGCAIVAFYVGPRYGKKSMLVYLTVCSLIGGLSVVATQGLGAAVVAQAAGKPQFNQWFLYVLLVFVVTTLLTEIVFLNKALNIFNAALVTPTYYVYFTSATIVTSAILFQGFKGSVMSIVTVVLGFLVICSGVVLLQLSKSAKDVPDAAVFKGDLNQVRTVAEQEEPESEPKADAIRGTAMLVRRFSEARQKKEAAEAKRIHEERMKDQMEPISEDEQVEWDGLRRRKTTLGSRSGNLQRQKTIHPPLGMAHFPDDDPLWDSESRPASADVHGGSGFHRFFSFRRKPSHITRTQSMSSTNPSPGGSQAVMQSRPITTIAALPPKEDEDTSYHGAQASDGAMEMDHVHGLPNTLAPPSPGRPVQWAENVEQQQEQASRRRGISDSSSLAPTPPPHANKRQFSFQKILHPHRNKSDSPTSPTFQSSNSAEAMNAPQPHRPTSRLGLGRSSKEKPAKAATEEERWGLVRGDGKLVTPSPDHSEPPTDDENSGWGSERKLRIPEIGPMDPALAKETSRTPLIQQQRQDDDGRESEEVEKIRLKWERDQSERGGNQERRYKEWDGGGGRGPPPAFI